MNWTEIKEKLREDLVLKATSVLSPETTGSKYIQCRVRTDRNNVERIQLVTPAEGEIPELVEPISIRDIWKHNDWELV